MSSVVKIHRSFVLDATPEQLWPLLSDTDRVNRLLGLPASEQYEPDENGVLTISGHFLGFAVTWREQPFEWVYQQWFESVRLFNPPLPIARLETTTRLQPLPDAKTAITIEVRLTARNIIGRISGPLVVGRKWLRDTERVYRQLTEIVRKNAAIVPAPQTPMVEAGRVRQSIERLRQFGTRADLVQRLAQHLSSADDAEVLRMRPFALADVWGEPRYDVLRMFLYATRSGLLDLEWAVICPNCRGASVRAPVLADLAENAHCLACNVRYDVNFDEAVELLFSVHAAIRTAIDASYCIGGPANTRHILAQTWLAPQSTKDVSIAFLAGEYRLRSRQLAAQAALRVAADARSHAATVRFGDTIDVAPPELAPGVGTLHLENPTDQSVLLVLEQTAWNAQAASAALVTAMDEFRQLFSSQVLAPGIGVSVRNLTFLFSDLKGSTAIYDTVGDAPAYARVRDHFIVMRDIIGRWRGALVKTIGDAVMAVFPSAEDAVEAAIAIQREFLVGDLRLTEPGLLVKLGLHRGPCIAVNANDLLDYFGSTVNVAARVQNESVGDDIVLTSELWDDAGVQRVIARAAPQVETFERMLKGVSQRYVLHRLWLAEAGQEDGRTVAERAENDRAEMAALTPT